MQLPSLTPLPICLSCGKQLRTPKSVARGRGPQCQRRHDAAEFRKQANLELQDEQRQYAKSRR